MPRYFFDLKNDLDVPDPEGRELADLLAAKCVAVAEAREIMTETLLDGAIDLDHRIGIRDESGAIVFVLPFADAITVQRGPEVLNQASA